MECKGCEVGISYCYHRPCWGTPEEFERILDSGYANKVQLEFWHQHTLGLATIEVLAPAVYQEVGTKNDLFSLLGSILGDPNKTPRKEREYENDHNGGKTANLDPLGKCVMLTEENLCELHSLGLKPKEGREACCKVDPEENNHHELALLWNTDYGKSIIKKWKKLVNYKE